jgi:hypothetical protein
MNQSPETAIMYLNPVSGSALATYHGKTPYMCIVITSSPTSVKWRNTLSEWLISTGCRYMMAWGEDCGQLHDAVDDANCAKFNYTDIPDQDFIMTTSHESEPLEEVFFFAKFCASQDGMPFEQLLILDVDHINREDELITLFRNSGKT